MNSNINPKYPTEPGPSGMMKDFSKCLLGDESCLVLMLYFTLFLATQSYNHKDDNNTLTLQILLVSADACLLHQQCMKISLHEEPQKMFKLPKSEEERINNILKRAFDKESGKLDESDVRLTEDNPDGRKYILKLLKTKLHTFIYLQFPSIYTY